VSVFIGSQEHAMAYFGGLNATGATYRFETALPAGTLAYYLFADDGNGTANNTARTADYQLTITAAGIPGFGAVEVAAAVAAAFALFTLARRRRRT